MSEKPETLTPKEISDLIEKKMRGVMARTSMTQAPNLIFQQRDVIRHSDPITQNQWYDAWDSSAVAAGAGSAQLNVRLLSITLDQAIANEDIEMRIIADDLDETITVTAVAGTDYEVRFIDDPDVATILDFDTTLNLAERGFLLEARSLQIMFRKTSAAGGNDTVVKIIYEQIP